MGPLTPFNSFPVAARGGSWSGRVGGGGLSILSQLLRLDLLLHLHLQPPSPLSILSQLLLLREVLRTEQDLNRAFNSFPVAAFEPPPASLSASPSSVSLSFNSFPVAAGRWSRSCSPPRTRGLSILSQLLPNEVPEFLEIVPKELSILSQLLPDVPLEPARQRPHRVFQFFPSCCRGRPPRRRRPSPAFNSFPVAASGHQEVQRAERVLPFNSFPVAAQHGSRSVQHRVRHLSILSQLLPGGSMIGWNALTEAITFNSFPVAARAT